MYGSLIRCSLPALTGAPPFSEAPPDKERPWGKNPSAAGRAYRCAPALGAERAASGRPRCEQSRAVHEAGPAVASNSGALGRAPSEVRGQLSLEHLAAARQLRCLARSRGQRGSARRLKPSTRRTRRFTAAQARPLPRPCSLRMGERCASPGLTAACRRGRTASSSSSFTAIATMSVPVFTAAASSISATICPPLISSAPSSRPSLEQLDEVDVFTHAEHRPRWRSSFLRAARAIVFGDEGSEIGVGAFFATGDDLVDAFAAAVEI